MRITFRKGQQRKFFDLVLEKAGCPSLRSLISRGFDVPYSTLKSYYNENRTLPEELFVNLCFLAGLSREEFNIESLKEHWGQVLGGKK